jgi:hypothetical protein
MQLFISKLQRARKLFPATAVALDRKEIGFGPRSELIEEVHDDSQTREFGAVSLLLTHREHAEDRRNRGPGDGDACESSHQRDHTPGQGFLFRSD